MSHSKPEFHLQRVNVDGTSESPVIYSLLDLPLDTPIGRRGMLGVGVAAGTVLSLLSNPESAIADEPALKRDDTVLTLDAVNLMNRTTRVATIPKGRPLKVLQLKGDWVQVVTLDLASEKRGWLKRTQIAIEGAVATSNTLPRHDGESLTAIHAHKNGVSRLAITPDGKLLASRSDNIVKLWSLPDGTLKKTLIGHHGRETAFAITPDGKMLVSGGDAVNLWSLPDGKLKKRLGQYATHIAITPSAKLLATGGGSLYLWSLPDGTRKKTLTTVKRGGEDINDLAITPDGKLLASNSKDHTVRLWSLPDGTLKMTLTGHDDPVYVLAITGDGKLLASGSADNTVGLWSLPDGTLEKTLIGHDDSVSTLAFTPDGKLLASGSADNTVKLWSLPDGTLKKTLTGYLGWDTGVAITVGGKQHASSLAITPDCKLLAFGSADKTVRLWSLPDGTLEKTLSGHDDSVSALAVTPDGTLLASGDASGVIILWDLKTRERRSYLFDSKESQTDAFTYTVTDKITGQIHSFTLPCGSPIPAGAVCTCNCVAGTYYIAPEVSIPRAVPRGRGFGGTYCSCNKICTCIPVCQAHHLLHPDPVVRAMAEQLLLVMGEQEFPYMTWASAQAESDLSERIQAIMAMIRTGATPDPALWPDQKSCASRLDDPDEVIAIMAAQMLKLHPRRDRMEYDESLHTRVVALLQCAYWKPWYIRVDPTVTLVANSPGSPETQDSACLRNPGPAHINVVEESGLP